MQQSSSLPARDRRASAPPFRSPSPIAGRSCDRDRSHERSDELHPRSTNDEALQDNPRLEPPGMACSPPFGTACHTCWSSHAEGGGKILKMGWGKARENPQFRWGKERENTPGES